MPYIADVPICECALNGLNAILESMERKCM